MNGSKVCFILYKPAVPGNIGSSARAIKTMGFSELRLIEPADHLADEAKMMAHGSHDILEKCKVFASYEEAVADLDFIVCTTAKKKSAKVDYIRSDELAGFLSERLSLFQKIGIVFGSEESGLPNNIIQQSNIGVTIPMSVSYPSLNLSQSVMVVAYELSLISAEFEKENTEAQSETTWKVLSERTSFILNKTGIKSASPLHHRIMERLSFMKASDARLAHSITSKILKLIKNDEQVK